MRKAGVRSATIRAASALLLLGVSGCSSVPNEVNPAEWYRSASSWLSSDPAPTSGEAAPSAVGTPLPAERADTFPNLASVPDRPAPTLDPAARRDMVASMRRESGEAQADAAALDRRAEAEVARREQPMVTQQPPSLPQPRPGAVPVERPTASLALPPDAAAPSARAPAPAGAQTERPQPAPAATTAPRETPVPGPAAAQPAAQEPPAARPSTTRAAGFTPGTPLAPRPPVQPPQPLSQRAAG